MFATLISTTFFFALAIQAVVADFTIDTPTFTQCQKSQVTWQDTGAGPYNLVVVPGSDPCGDVLADLGDHAGTSMTWLVNLAAGTSVELSLEDASGNEAWSGVITIGSSSDSSCLPAAASSASSSSVAGGGAITPSGDSIVTPTTLVVPGTTTAADTSSTGNAVPVGAANAGINPLGEKSSGALALRSLNTPVLVASALGVLYALL
ncbi:hypothetical protein JAAARDRAFT_157271 [Jaapia argillacea MUCL 33604]|uniref:Uncharacterized protein n=1 Tax=Jaapia argillacea MUCL 33604 TaxID=933084 RepID=A0A067Q3I6_9AGAM|nr:hypothetical protein JAAARDRAFT_157271 [Jaapia argillacea MUCL 33604]